MGTNIERPDDTPRCRRSRIRRLFVILIVIGFAVPCVYLLAWIQRHQRHRRTYERIEDVIVSLEDRCPDDVPRTHWYFAVGWTENALGNCLAVSEYLVDTNNSEEQFSQFASELEHRAREKVGPETIEWIWDQIERISTCGKHYSDNWRPVRNGRFKEPDCEWAGMPQSQWSYASTANSRVFHRHGCPSISTLSWRQITVRFGDRQSAIDSGFSPCPECKP
jgi:hypothetical protein